MEHLQHRCPIGKQEVQRSRLYWRISHGPCLEDAYTDPNEIQTAQQLYDGNLTMAPFGAHGAKCDPCHRTYHWVAIHCNSTAPARCYRELRGEPGIILPVRSMDLARKHDKPGTAVQVEAEQAKWLEPSQGANQDDIVASLVLGLMILMLTKEGSAH